MKNELRPLLATFAGLVFALPWMRAQDWLAEGDEEGKIVFALKRPGLSQICVADADGSALRKLTPPEMAAFSPSWSPDGRTIVFVSETDKKTRICTVDSDGGGLRTLAQVGDVNRWPQWSPDGRRISFVSSRDSADPKYPANDIELYVMNADGTNLQRLAPKECVDSMSWFPQWSPDGSEILFVRRPSGRGARVSLVEADGSNLRTVAEADSPAKWYSYALWSPDGKKIWCGEGGGELAEMDPDGTNRRTAVSVDFGVRSGGVSPDGKRILYSGIHSSKVVTADLNGENAVEISAGAGDYNELIWSPDGERVGFSFTPEFARDTRHYFVASSDGSGLVQLDVDAPERELLVAAERAFNERRFSEAADLYGKALAVDPGDRSLRKKLGDSFMGAMDYPRAADAYLATNGAPGMAPLFGTVQEIAEQFSAEGKYDEAALFYLKCRERYAAENGQDAIWAELERDLGKVYLAQGKLDPAIAALKRSVSGKDLPVSRVLLAQAYLENRQYQEAIDAAQASAVPLEAGEVNAFPQLGVPPYFMTRAYAFLFTGLAYQGLHLPDQAAGAFEKAVELDPPEAELHLLLGKAQVQAGRFEQAVDPLNKALELKPDDDLAYVWLGQAQFGMGSCARAVRMYELAHHLNPGNANTCAWLGFLYRLQGQYAQAKGAAQEAISLDPGNPQYYQDAADACLGLAEFGAAADLLKKGAALASGEGLGRYGDFVELLDRGLGASPQGTADWEFELDYCGSITARNPLHKGLGDGEWEQMEARAQTAEAAGNLYSALQLYTYLFRHGRTAGQEDLARVEGVRGKILGIYNRLPVKLLPDPLALTLAAKAREQAAMSVGVTTGNRFNTAALLYSMALDEAPWWAEGYFNLAVAEHAEDTDLSGRAANADMAHFISLASDPSERERAQRLLAQWSEGARAGRKDGGD